MSDAICKQIFEGINNEKLRFLNISRNCLSGDSLDNVVRVLSRNPDLQKLAMQHNRFGEGNVEHFAAILKSHQSLEYLDISGNKIRNFSFILIYSAVQSQTSRLCTLQCRKNKIGGPKVDDVLRLRSGHLTRLNLTGN